MNSVHRWTPSSMYTPEEKSLLSRLVRTRKLYKFLREHRLDIFDDDFQHELASMYRNSGAGKPPVPPALMCMACLLQAYQGVSDAEAVEMTVVDLRWRLVLGRLGETGPAFSQGALCDFRQRMIKHDMDRRLLERAAEIAQQSGEFDYKKLPKDLRLAVDSAPLDGAGRVEDTINLLAHAARKVVACASAILGESSDDICRQAEIELLRAPSAKRGLDRVWTEPGERDVAVTELLTQVGSLHRWLEEKMPIQMAKSPLKDDVATLDQIITQDTEPDPGPGGGARVKKGVAEDRRISVEDPDMRHGRKSRSKRIDGYKRHIALNLDDGVIEACALTPANKPDAAALVALNDDIQSNGKTIRELYIDRGYVSSPFITTLLGAGGEVICRPWQQTNRNGLYNKKDFNVDLDAMTVTCPGGTVIPVRLGAAVSYPATACESCPRRSECTDATCGKGRSLHIAPDEALQQRLREIASTETGRDTIRRRVPVEHSLAHIAQRQGKRARYVGARKNLYDLRRACAIQNFETAQRAAA